MPTAIDVFEKVRGHERAEQLRAARETDLLPYFRTVESSAAPVMEMEGAERIMLGSNNYLGLTGDPRVIAGARDALERFGTGLTGSRLLNGTTELHLTLEREIAEWMGTEEAIVFTTGHQANVGTLGTILSPGDTVIADSADHASILDGCILSRAKLRPFRHGRLDKLEKMLERAGEDGGGVLVVVDGVFSMEGDVADLPRVVELCRAHGARLMVDEAHAAGVLGARGAGTSEHFGLEAEVDLRMGTFSKSLASCGGFIAGTHEVIDFLRISSRAFLFTASAVPAAIGAALAALRIVRSDEGPQLFAQVLDNARYLRDGLRDLGFGRRPAGDDPDHPRGGRRRLEGRAAVARALRRGRVRQRRAAPGRPAGRRAAADERDGDSRSRHAGQGALNLRNGQERIRVRARPAAAIRAHIAHFSLWRVISRPLEITRFLRIFGSVPG
jgi:8-amino-7-oxononanoate synthase